MICPSVKLPELEVGKRRTRSVGFLKTRLRLGQTHGADGQSLRLSGIALIDGRHFGDEIVRLLWLLV